MDDSVARAQWARETVAMLHTLPPPSAHVLSLTYFELLTEQQICAQTGWSERIVRGAQAAGLHELGQLLQTAAHGPPATATS